MKNKVAMQQCKEAARCTSASTSASVSSLHGSDQKGGKASSARAQHDSTTMSVFAVMMQTARDDASNKKQKCEQAK